MFMDVFQMKHQQENMYLCIQVIFCIDIFEVLFTFLVFVFYFFSACPVWGWADWRQTDEWMFQLKNFLVLHNK